MLASDHLQYLLTVHNRHLIIKQYQIRSVRRQIFDRHSPGVSEGHLIRFLQPSLYITEHSTRIIYNQYLLLILFTEFLLISRNRAYNFADIDRPLESLPDQILGYDLLNRIQLIHVPYNKDGNISLGRLILNEVERLQLLQHILIHIEYHNRRRFLYLIDGINVRLHHRHFIFCLLKPAFQ